MSTSANFNAPDATAVSPPLQETLAPTQYPRKELSATSLLIIANTLIFYAMVAYWIYITDTENVRNTLVFARFDSKLSLSWGSDYGPLTLTGQFWRVFTSTFLHSNFPHLALNMLFLWRLGKPLDAIFARTHILGVYLLTGAAASICSLYWDPLAASTGSSGAIYGLAGVWIALLVFGRLGLSRRKVIGILIWLFLLIPFGLLSGHASDHIDYAAHAGGIVSGFVIGIFVALIFRLPEAERPARQRVLLQFAAAALVFLFAAVTELRRSAVMARLNPEKPQSVVTTTFEHHSKPRIARVFLDLKGDPKMVRYFSGLLNAELGNTGITVARSKRDADGVLRGQLNAQVERVNLSMGVVKMYINSQRGFQTIDSCQTLSTGEDSNLYERSAASAVSDIRNRYQDARTVRLEPASDLAASRQFAAEFPSKLKTSGLTMVQSGPADIALQITLLTQKVPVEEDEAVYDIKIVNSDGAPLFKSSGSGVLSARLVGDAPAVCPERLADLEWLYNSNTLASIAHKVANNLYASQAAPRAASQPQKSK